METRYASVALESSVQRAVCHLYQQAEQGPSLRDQPDWDLAPSIKGKGWATLDRLGLRCIKVCTSRPVRTLVDKESYFVPNNNRQLKMLPR